ncbi:MAG: carboxypeptidase-like regulatory domain-containing protein [Acidobacteriaceae bacterium]
MAHAQFSSSVSGEVEDPSGSVIPGAKLTLTKTDTGAVKTATTDSSGVYQFVSLPPGPYLLATTAAGFASTQSVFTLQTGQTLNLPVKLAVGSTTQLIKVTSQAPVLDTADTRLQETMSTQTLSSLPLAGRSMISLVTLAPGVTGLGVTSNGSPGSGRDNFSTETQVDASANGQGAVGNMYIVDGLDVTSSIRPGVLNLTPNPDSIQETSIQTNTYNVDFGRASSIQMTMTTKSGTNRYHGNASDYFTYQNWLARTEFTQSYAPFHSNNISATIGGPIIPRRNWGFFFFAIEPLRASAASTGQITFEDPEFTAFAQTAFPNTIGTQLLTSYPVSHVTNATVSATAADLFPGTCGTAATSDLPCSTAMVDSGNFSSTSFRNGMQWDIRLDKDFRNDRLYGTFYRTTLTSNGISPRAAFNTVSNFFQYALQVNETHTFSPTTLNEAAFAAMRVEGIQPATGLFSVPVVNVTSIGSGFGAGFAQGDFIQHNYHWRDVLTHTIKSHVIKIGYEGLFGDDVEIFNGPWDQPVFQFNSLLDLAQDNVFTESNLAYNPLTGERDQYNWNAAGITNGAFAEDTWRMTPRLTANFGLRWDDFGNPYSRSANTAFSNFYLGAGQTQQEQIANGVLIRHNHALNRAITDVFSPRGGIAWDVAGNGKWLVKGGAGLFHNWPTMANLQEQYRGNPPGDIFPTFFGASGPAPIFGFGTSNEKPFNFPAPDLSAFTLNDKGGINGLQFNIGAIDPNLRSPVTYTYSAAVEHELTSNVVASIAYSGANGRDLLSGGGQVYNVSYGQDINSLPGDLIIHNSTVPTRLNTSFGQVNYTQNDRVSNYNGLILAVRGRFSHAFFNGSYTRSSSQDDTQVYPTYTNPHQFYGPSIWDAPNRFSFAGNYEFPSLNHGNGFMGRVSGGWQLSGTGILQSGTPFTVSTNAAFNPIVGPGGIYTGYAPGSGDYNADGDNFDFPDVSSYHYDASRSSYLKGLFAADNFPQPAFGSEGNERYSSFREPGFAEWDAAALKNTAITEGVSFQLRFEFYNLFNRVNLNNVDANLPDGNFGRATGQYTPRFMQIGGNLVF